MPNEVSIQDVQHVAALARLGLTGEQAESLARDLTAILGHMEVLNKVDASGAAELAVGEGAAMRLREDRGGSVPLTASLDAIAPEMRDGFFVVPRLASHEDLESRG